MLPQLRQRCVALLRDLTASDETTDATVLVSAATLARIVSVIAAVASARILGVEAFAVLTLLQLTVAMFQTVSGAAFAETATRYVAALHATNSERAAGVARLSVRTSTAAGVVCSLLVVAFAPNIAATLPASGLTALLLTLTAPAVCFSAISTTQLGILTGLRRFRATARLTLATGLTAGLLTVLGAQYDGLRGATVGLVGAAGLSFGFTSYWYRRVKSEILPRSSLVRLPRETGVLLHFSLPAALGALLVLPVSWGCAVLLGRSPDGLRELGRYNAANQWFQALLFIPGLASQIILPSLAQPVQVASERTQLAWRAVRANAVLAMGLAIVLGTLSPLLMALYGPEFVGGWPTLVLALTTGALVAGVSPLGHLLVAVGRMWTGLTLNVAWAILFIGGSLALVRFGAAGLASARLIAYAVHAVLLSTIIAGSVGPLLRSDGPGR